MKKRAVVVAVWLAVGTFDYSAWMAMNQDDDIRHPWRSEADAHIWSRRERAMGVFIGATGPLAFPVVFVVSGIYANGFSY